MKTRWKILVLLGAMVLLSACEGRSDTLPEPSSGPVSAAPEEQARLTCRLVDGAEDGSLLLAGLDGDAGVYRLGVGEVPVTVDGQAAAAGDLADGMEVTVVFDGMVQESYPGGFYEVYALEAVTPLDGSYTDLCGFYLAVLDDLWQVDEGLNGETVAIDLSQAPGELTQAEQAAIAWRFGELHGVRALTATFEELLADGMVTAEPLEEHDPDGPAFYQWKEGSLLAITSHETGETEAYSLPVLRFDAQKWASSLGAYHFYDCTAVWPERGTWTDYCVGSEMVS